MSFPRTLGVFLLALFACVSAQGDTISSVVPFSSVYFNETTAAAFPIICSGSCNKRGICIQGVFCSCYQGFFGQTCELSLLDIYGSTWTFFQYVFAIGYLVLFLWAVWIVYNLYSYRKKNIQTNPVSLQSNKIAIWIMSIHAAFEFYNMLIFFVDPLGTILYPYWMIAIWFAYRICFAVTVLGLILFHWMEVFHTATQQLKRQEELNKISIYGADKDITLDDVLMQTNAMFKWKVPYIVCVCIIAVYQIPVVVAQLTYHPASLYLGMSQFVILCVFYLFFEIGFLVYGRRLTALIPKDNLDRFKYLNHKVQAYVFSGIVILVFYSFWNFLWVTPLGILMNYIFGSLNQWVLTPLIYSCYQRWNFRSLRGIIEDYIVGTNTPVTTENATNTTRIESQTDDSTDITV